MAKLDPAAFAVDNYHFRTQGFFLSGPGAALPAAKRASLRTRPRAPLPKAGGERGEEAGDSGAGEPPLLSFDPGAEGGSGRESGRESGSSSSSSSGSSGPGGWLPFQRVALDFVGRVEHFEEDWDAVSTVSSTLLFLVFSPTQAGSGKRVLEKHRVVQIANGSVGEKHESNQKYQVRACICMCARACS